MAKSEAEKTIALMQQRERLMRTNEVRLAGVVMEINALDLSPKLDKSKQPILNEKGEVQYYDPMFWCSVGVVGSEEGVLLSEELANKVQVDSTYLFEGRLKNRKFKVYNLTEI